MNNIIIASIIGFSFGASLAMAVYAELWNQSCLEIDDLKANVACFGFGAPVFNLSCVENIYEKEKASNTHLFYTDDDVFPRALQCVNFPKLETPKPSPSVSKVCECKITAGICTVL